MWSQPPSYLSCRIRLKSHWCIPAVVANTGPLHPNGRASSTSQGCRKSHPKGSSPLEMQVSVTDSVRNWPSFTWKPRDNTTLTEFEDWKVRFQSSLAWRRTRWVFQPGKVPATNGLGTGVALAPECSKLWKTGWLSSKTPQVSCNSPSVKQCASVLF